MSKVLRSVDTWSGHTVSLENGKRRLKARHFLSCRAAQ